MTGSHSSQTNQGMFRVTASTVGEALAEVHRLAGPDAQIIHLKRVPTPGLARIWGGKQIEALASRKTVSEPSRRSRQAVREEPWDSDSIAKILTQLGFLPDLAVAISAEAGRRAERPLSPKEQWLEVTATLLERWDRLSARVPKHPGRVALIGTPGSGKSTCIAKWLTQETILHQRSCRLWRLDVPVTNSADFLSLHAEMMGVAVERFWSVQPPVDKEWLDIQGWDPNDVTNDQVANLLDRFQPEFVGLVLNASYELKILQAQIERYRALKPDGLVLTHLDEDSHAAKFWNLSLGSRMPVCFTSRGATIPGGFDPVSAEQSLEALLSHT